MAQEQQAGTPSADLTLGLGVDERFARNGATFLTDALGSTTALASAGAVQTSYGYDPYGVAQVTGTASDNPFQYTGRENDGTGLLHYRNRYYSPTWARFVSEDPIGLGGGDANLYRYVANNPVQGRDPSGEFLPVAIAVAGALGIEGLADATLVAAAVAAAGALAQCLMSGACSPPGSGSSPIPMPPLPVPANPKAKPAPGNPADPCSGDVLCARQLGDNKPRSTLPREPNGNYSPDPAAEGPHSTIGTRTSSNGVPYRQGATFDENGRFLGRTDVTDHPPNMHPNPHFHPATSPNGTGPFQSIP